MLIRLPGSKLREITDLEGISHDAPGKHIKAVAMETGEEQEGANEGDDEDGTGAIADADMGDEEDPQSFANVPRSSLALALSYWATAGTYTRLSVLSVSCITTIGRIGVGAVEHALSARDVTMGGVPGTYSLIATRRS